MSGTYIEILLLAVVAGFLIIRLVKVFGGKNYELSEDERRRLQERKQTIEAELQRKHMESSADNSASEITLDDPAPTAGRIASVYSDDEDKFTGASEDLRKYDKDFSLSHFLKGAESAFVMVVEAFAAGDRKTLRALTDDAIYGLFNDAITAREKQGHTQATTLVKVDRASAKDITRDSNNAALITVSFRSEQVVQVKDSEGALISGDAAAMIRMHDIWTFRRNLKKNDPNWRLTRTATAPFDEPSSAPAAAVAKA